MDKKRNDFFSFPFLSIFCGGDGTRIRVQTIEQNAFYMLIPRFCFGTIRWRKTLTVPIRSEILSLGRMEILETCLGVGDTHSDKPTSVQNSSWIMALPLP